MRVSKQLTTIGAETACLLSFCLIAAAVLSQREFVLKNFIGAREISLGANSQRRKWSSHG